jgi:hypothetical protein
MEVLRRRNYKITRQPNTKGGRFITRSSRGVGM